MCPLFSFKGSTLSPDVVEHVRTVAARVAASYGLDIFDVQFRREAAGMVLRIQIDRPGPAATAEDLYNVACMYALASRLAPGEGPRSYAENAVESLRQAMARGYRDLAHLQEDQDLEGLRSREDFKEFEKDLEAVSGGTQDPVQSSR